MLSYNNQIRVLNSDSYHVILAKETPKSYNLPRLPERQSGRLQFEMPESLSLRELESDSGSDASHTPGILTLPTRTFRKHNQDCMSMHPSNLSAPNIDVAHGLHMKAPH